MKHKISKILNTMLNYAKNTTESQKFHSDSYLKSREVIRLYKIDTILRGQRDVD